MIIECISFVLLTMMKTCSKTRLPIGGRSGTPSLHQKVSEDTEVDDKSFSHYSAMHSLECLPLKGPFRHCNAVDFVFVHTRGTYLAGVDYLGSRLKFPREKQTRSTNSMMWGSGSTAPKYAVVVYDEPFSGFFATGRITSFTTRNDDGRNDDRGDQNYPPDRA